MFYVHISICMIAQSEIKLLLLLMCKSNNTLVEINWQALKETIHWLSAGKATLTWSHVDLQK